jgi:hypothetical protein
VSSVDIPIAIACILRIFRSSGGGVISYALGEVGLIFNTYRNFSGFTDVSRTNLRFRKVKFALDQAMKTQRGSRGRAPLFLGQRR